MADFSLGGETLQARAEGGGAHGARFVQVMEGRRFLELRQGLTHAILRCWRAARLGDGLFQHSEGQGGAGF